MAKDVDALSQVHSDQCFNGAVGVKEHLRPPYGVSVVCGESSHEPTVIRGCPIGCCNRLLTVLGRGGGGREIPCKNVFLIVGLVVHLQVEGMGRGDPLPFQRIALRGVEREVFGL